MASMKKPAEKATPPKPKNLDQASQPTTAKSHFLEKILHIFIGRNNKKKTYKEILSEEPGDSRNLKMPVEQLVVTGIASALIFVAFIILLTVSLYKPNQTQAKQNIERIGKQTVFQLQLALWQVRKISEKIASHPTVIDTLNTKRASGKPEQIKSLTSLLGRGIPYRSAVFLVTRDTLESLPRSLGFTAVDLARRGLKGDKFSVEAAQIGSDWQLFISSPVKRGNRAIGAVLLVLDMSILQTPMVMTDKSLGQILVLQSRGTSRGTRSRPIISTGTPTPKSNHSWKVDLEDTDWSVVFHPSRQFLDESRRSPMLALAAMLISLLSVVGVSLHTAYITRRKANDYFANAILEHEKLGTASTKIKDSIKQGSDQDNSKKILEDIQAIPESIFRAHDIRGLVGQTLTESTMTLLGRAIGSAAIAQNEKTILVANDGRLSSPMLKASLVVGLVSSGCKVVSVGMIPTPMLYFAIQTLKVNSGIMITGSHSPADYNGLKVMLAGKRLYGPEIEDLYRRIQEQDFELPQTGSSEEMTSRYLRHVSSADISPHYLKQLLNNINLSKPLKVVVDCGNGVAGRFVPKLFEKLGCEVTPIYCNVDGTFPNHSPNPCDPENLKELIKTVVTTKADIGVALDGDGDRINLISKKGSIVSPDRLMMILAKDIISRHPKANIVVDAACSHHLLKVIKESGGGFHMCGTGHTVIREKMAETKAFLAGDVSGHIFIKERWFGFDDAIYCAARMLEYLSEQSGTLDDVLAALPSAVRSPEIRIPTTEEGKATLMDYLKNTADFKGATKSTLDGIRIDFPLGWGIVRASGTTPAIVLRFEADNDEELEKIKAHFRRQLLTADPGLKFSF